MSLDLRIAFVPVWNYRADPFAALGFCLDRRPDFFACVTGKPFVEQIFERSVLIAFAVKRIVIVIDSDIADIPPRKKYLGIIADLNIIAPETGKVFGNQSGDPSLLHQFQKPLKIRAVEADTGITVIHKNFDVFKAVILCVFGQNGFLIDDAVAVTFVFIFLRETAVQRCDFLFVLV